MRTCNVSQGHAARQHCAPFIVGQTLPASAGADIPVCLARGLPTRERVCGIGPGVADPMAGRNACPTRDRAATKPGLLPIAGEEQHEVVERRVAGVVEVTGDPGAGRGAGGLIAAEEEREIVERGSAAEVGVAVVGVLHEHVVRRQARDAGEAALAEDGVRSVTNRGAASRIARRGGTGDAAGTEPRTAVEARRDGGAVGGGRASPGSARCRRRRARSPSPCSDCRRRSRARTAQVP